MNNMYNNQFTPYMQNFSQYSQQNPMIQTKTIGLQGKVVDSVEVAKTIDYVLDGSISYFPLTDGSTIVSKQLQIDGTSKIVIYKPIEQKNNEKIEYATINDLKAYFRENYEDMINDISDDINGIKKAIKSIKKES